MRAVTRRPGPIVALTLLMLLAGLPAMSTTSAAVARGAVRSTATAAYQPPGAGGPNRSASGPSLALTWSATTTHAGVPITLARSRRWEPTAPLRSAPATSW